ncbi:MAG: hypothetical protein H2184_04420 [Candidatus Galacturonibacter soehngenii]|nr:hypothetical protein [Candidatus Galacturonibacter soehngenii]
MNKKSFWIGVLTGVIALIAIEGAVIGGRALFYMKDESQLSDVTYEEGQEDEVIEASSGVFAENGNAIITDAEEGIKIEVVPPSGYTQSKDYESAFDAEYYNEDKTIRINYSIENHTEQEMESYYEFEKEIIATSKDVSYTNIATSDVKTLEVNGYKVNYISLSYTYEETENYIEYCAYVMIDDSTQFMCNIYGTAETVKEDIIKECFGSQIPVSK